MSDLHDYYSFANVMCGATKPEEKASTGPWHCIAYSDPEYTEDPEAMLDFLEVHLSHRGDGIVFRVNLYVRSTIQLGKCTILDLPRAIQVRDRLDYLIKLLRENKANDKLL